jgi:two-component system, NarL family, response regulator LiaR
LAAIAMLQVNRGLLVQSLLKVKEMQKTLYQPHSTVAQSSVTLSDRELQVLRLVAEGYSNPEIATALYLSLSTIKSHIRNIMNKLNMEHRIQLAVFAVRNQLA